MTGRFSPAWKLNPGLCRYTRMKYGPILPDNSGVQLKCHLQVSDHLQCSAAISTDRQGFPLQCILLKSVSGPIIISIPPVRLPYLRIGRSADMQIRVAWLAGGKDQALRPWRSCGAAARRPSYSPCARSSRPQRQSPFRSRAGLASASLRLRLYAMR